MTLRSSSTKLNQRHELPMVMSPNVLKKKHDGVPTQATVPRRHSTSTSTRQGLFRRSRSFGTGNRPAPANFASLATITTSGSNSSPLKRVPRRSSSIGPAQVAALIHQQLQQEEELQEHKQEDQEDSRVLTSKLSDDFDEKPKRVSAPSSLLRMTPRTTATSTTTQNNDMEIPLLIPTSSHHSTSYNTNKGNTTTNSSHRLYRLLYICIALGMGGLWVSMGGILNIAHDNSHSHRHHPHHKHQNHPQPDFEQEAFRLTTTPPKNSGLRTVQTQIRTKFTNLLLERHITTMARLDDPTSPAQEALHWLVDNAIASHQWNVPPDTMISRFALATLYFATHTVGSMWAQGEQQWAHTSANHKAPNLCQWHGITCDNDNNHHVTHIQLSHNQLQGTLPDELFAGLTHLQVLDLSHNSLWGSLPSNWDASPSLHTLYLQENALTGTIPDQLKSIKDMLQSTHLKHVQLSHNDFVGQQPHVQKVV